MNRILSQLAHPKEYDFRRYGFDLGPRRSEWYLFTVLTGLEAHDSSANFTEADKLLYVSLWSFDLRSQTEDHPNRDTGPLSKSQDKQENIDLARTSQISFPCIIRA